MTKAPVSSFVVLIPRILPFALAFCGYATLALCSQGTGRLWLGVWWGAQAIGWLGCALFLRAARGGWPATRWIVAGALAFRLCGLAAPPTIEDDYHRYLWDGWRTLRDGTSYDRAPQEFFGVAEERPAGIETALDELNHPDIATIYAPVTQALFAAAALVSPGRLLPLKILLLLVDGAVLLLLARYRGGRAAWFYGWCPLVIVENAFHAHPEAWGLVWLLAAWFCAERERFILAGLLAGIAVAAKILALLAVPFLIWRRPALVLPFFLIAVASIYGPILASGSYAEWWGLRAMAELWEFNSSGFALLAAVWGSGPARLLWPIVFGLFAAALFARWAWWGETLRAAPVAGVLLGFLLLSPVFNPWYLVWLAPFVAAAPSRGMVALLAIAPLSYATGLNLGDPALGPYAHPAWVRPVEFGIFLLASLSGYIQRR